MAGDRDTRQKASTTGEITSKAYRSVSSSSLRLVFIVMTLPISSRRQQAADFAIGEIEAVGSEISRELVINAPQSPSCVLSSA